MIKFLDLAKINQLYFQELKQGVTEVISSGWYIHGPWVKQFEDSLAKYLDVRHCIGVGNGFDSLKLILRAYIEMGFMQEGDEVIVPANTFIASVLAITENRLKPVLVDPDIDTYNLNISLIEKSITKRTRAIMVVHLYGRICWSNVLEDLAQSYNLKIIEDNAQALGASIEMKGTVTKSGALGDAAGLSFYPAKNLGALGDGGAVCTNDEELDEVVRALANYGSKRKYINDFKGVNSRLDEIQAKILGVKLKYLDAENNTRRLLAQHYIHSIKNDDVILPDGRGKNIVDDESHVWHLFVIRHKNRDRLSGYLDDNGIETLIHYPVPVHKQSAYKEYNDLAFPVTERIQNEILSLPVSSVLSIEEVSFVAERINAFEG